MSKKKIGWLFEENGLWYFQYPCAKVVVSVWETENLSDFVGVYDRVEWKTKQQALNYIESALPDMFNVVARPSGVTYCGKCENWKRKGRTQLGVCSVTGDGKHVCGYCVGVFEC